MSRDLHTMDNDPAGQSLGYLERVRAELLERLTSGCALSSAERAHISAMLAMVQGQIERRDSATANWV